MSVGGFARGWAFVFGVSSALAATAVAQESEAVRLAFPARSNAAVPDAVVSQGFSWDAQMHIASRTAPAGFGLRQMLRQDAHAAIPYEALVVTVDASSLALWIYPDSPIEGLVVTPLVSELGAFFRASPASWMRARVGGAVAVPWADAGVVHDRSLGRPLPDYIDEPLDLPASIRWNAYRLYRSYDFAVVASGSIEWTLDAAVSVALEATLPMLIDDRGRYRFLPQVAVSLVGLIRGVHHLGVRTELVTPDEVGPTVGLELFLRLVYPSDSPPRPFVRLAMRTPLGLRFPVDRTWVDDPVAWLGASLRLGASY